MNKRYVSIKVSVRPDAQWFQALKEQCAANGINVRWQKGHFHITAAFILNMPDDANWYAALYKALAWKVGPVITLDTLDVFTSSTNQQIVYLTTSEPSEPLTNLIRQVRDEITAIGCSISPNFKLHITLGRVENSQCDIKQLTAIVKAVPMPAFTLQLKQADFLEYKTNKLLCEFRFYENQQEADEALEARKRQAFRNAGSNMLLSEDDL